jgi:ribosomal protein L44E
MHKKRSTSTCVASESSTAQNSLATCSRKNAAPSSLHEDLRRLAIKQTNNGGQDEPPFLKNSGRTTNLLSCTECARSLAREDAPRKRPPFSSGQRRPKGYTGCYLGCCFGSTIGVTHSQTQYLSQVDKFDVASSADEAVKFPHAPTPTDLRLS